MSSKQSSYTNGWRQANHYRSWDIPGFLARDLGHCREFAAEWLAFDEFEKAPEVYSPYSPCIRYNVATKLMCTQQFSSIIWPTDYWKIIDPKQASEAKSFAQRAAAKLNVDLVDISFEKCWSASPPTKVATSLQQFINPVCSSLLLLQLHASKNPARLLKFWRLMYTRTARSFAFAMRICLGERHTQRFRMSGSGKIYNLQSTHSHPFSPLSRFSYLFLTPVLWQSRSAGKAITQKQRDEGFKRINTYREWFQQAVRTNENTNAIVIMPIESAEPRYRDEFPE